MAEPPLLAGAVNDTVAWVLPAVAVPMVGAPGADGRTMVPDCPAKFVGELTAVVMT
jgi:hypothetical protein